MAANEINDLFATPITVLIENTFTAFKYSSFIRGYHVYQRMPCLSEDAMFIRGCHVYKDVWIHIIGDDSLTCEQEQRNENDKNAVAII